MQDSIRHTCVTRDVLIGLQSSYRDGARDSNLRSHNKQSYIDALSKKKSEDNTTHKGPIECTANQEENANDGFSYLHILFASRGKRLNANKK